MNRVVLNENQKEWKNQIERSFKAYGQGALNLATSIGKSYIAKDIIDDIIESDNEAEILWISSASAIRNVSTDKGLFCDEDYIDKITYINYEHIRLNTEYVSSYNFRKLKLIVIDEAHGALANKTYKGIKYTLDKLIYNKNIAKKNKPKLLIMTANKIRSCDGRSPFKVLTPCLQEGIDYEPVSLKEALNRDLLCDVHFIKCDLYKYQKMAERILTKIDDERYSIALKNIKDKMSLMLDDIISYKNNLAIRLGRDMCNKIKHEYDASNGDQWFVFYSNIGEALNNAGFIKELFENAYLHNSNVKVNVFQYHTGVTDEECAKSLEMMKKVPDKNVVNVYVTVNKGGESVHPVNIRGEVQFRRTSSQNLYEQFIGRAIKSKEYGQGASYVFDLMNNESAIIQGGCINYGTCDADSRLGLSFDLEDESLEQKLETEYFGHLDFSLINSDFESLVNKYYEIRNIDSIETNALKVAAILDYEVKNNIMAMSEPDRNEMGAYKKYLRLNPYMLVKKKDEELAEWFANIQHRFLAGDFGKTTVTDKGSIEHELLLNILGNVMFITKNVADYQRDDTNFSVKELVKIAEDVEKFNYDYKNRISKTLELKKDIEKLRQLYVEGRLPIGLVELCNYYRIDIKGINVDLVKQTMDKALLSDDIKDRFDRLRKVCNKVQNIEESILSGSGSISSEEDKYKYYIKAAAYYSYLALRYRGPEAEKLLVAIKEQYKFIRNISSIPTIQKANQFIRAVCLAREDSESSYIVKQYETDLLHYAYKIEQGIKLSDYEKEVLAIFGIKAFIKKSESIEKIMKLTKFNWLLEKLETRELSDGLIKKYVEQISEIPIYVIPKTYYKRYIKIKNELIKVEVETKSVKELTREFEFKFNKYYENEESDKDIIKKLRSIKKEGLKDIDMIIACFSATCRESLSDYKDNLMSWEIDDDTKLLIRTSKSMSKNYVSKLKLLIDNNLIDDKSKEIALGMINMQ